MMENPHTKVVLCGVSSVGKTSIVQRILKKDIDEAPVTTMGAGFATIIYTLNNTDIPLNIWDTAGQEAYRSLVSVFFRNVEIAVIVFDITSPKSFDAVPDWIDEVNANSATTDPVFILVGNKADLSSKRKVQQEQITAFASAREMKYFEVSAADNTMIDNLMHYLAQTALFLHTAQSELQTDPEIISVLDTEMNQPKIGTCC